MTVTAARLAGRPGNPVLVVGPSLGTSAYTLWAATVADLADEFDVIAWDLPGHAANRSPSPDRLDMAELAGAVIAAVDTVDGVGENTPFHYAGDSVGGAVGLQLLLNHPLRVATAALLCTGSRIGTQDSWRERQELVRSYGTTALVETAAQRWFGPEFTNREPYLADRLLQELGQVDAAGYVAVCDALATFDVTDRLDDIDTPVLAIAGDRDQATPVASLQAISQGVRRGSLAVLPGVAHLAPAEAPYEVARLIRTHALGAGGDTRSIGEMRAAGMTVRRQVLGDAHVDRASAAATDFTRDFQQFITEYAWGGIWTRPGLDRRSRSLITLTALVARGHHEEFAMHVRAARTNGVSVSEIRELLMQTSVYCGVPDANTAFRIAQNTLRELGDV